MKPRAIIRWASALLALVLLTLPRSVEACAACFGRSDSPMAQGMNMGILTLLVVIMSVLLAIGIFFAYILRRAARLARSQRPLDAATDLSGTLSSTASQSTQ